MVHNIFAQVEGKEQTLVYDEQEARVLANFITSCIEPSAQNYSQMHMWQKGVKVFKSQGVHSYFLEKTGDQFCSKTTVLGEE